MDKNNSSEEIEQKFEEIKELLENECMLQITVKCIKCGEILGTGSFLDHKERDIESIIIQQIAKKICLNEILGNM